VALATRSGGRWARRRWLLVALALVAAAALLLSFGLFPQDALRRLAERRVLSALGAGAVARIGRLHLVPARLSVEVADVEVRTPGWSVELPRGALRLSASSMLGAVRVARLELERPSLAVRLPLATAQQPPPAVTALTLPVEIAELSVTGGRLRLETPRGGLALEPWSASGSVGSGALDLSGAGGAWTPEPGSAGVAPASSLGPWHARVSVSPGLDVALLDGQVEAAGSRLRARGPLLRAAIPRPDVTLEGDLDLAGLARVAANATAGGKQQPLPAVSGALALRATLRDPAGPREASRLRADMALGGADLALAGVALDQLRVTGHWDAGPELGGLQWTARAFGGRIEGRTSVARHRIEGTTSAQGVDLSRLPGAPAVTGTADLELRWTGDPSRSVDVQAKAATRARRGDMEGSAEAEASGAVVPGSRSIDVTWSARAAGEASEGATLNAEARGSATGPLPPRVEGTVAATLLVPRGPSAASPGGDPGVPAALRAELTGAFHSAGQRHAAELDARLLGGALRVEASADGPLLERLALRGEGFDLAALGAGLSGRAQLDATASGPLARPALAGVASVDGLAWLGASFGRLDVTLSGDASRPQGELSLPELNARARVAVPAVSVRGAATGRRAVGSVELLKMPLARFAPLLGGSDPAQAPALEGALALTADFDVPLEQPQEGTATLAVQSIEARRGPLQAASGPFGVSLAGGVVSIAGLTLEGSGASVTAAGRISLAGPPRATTGAGLLDLRLGIQVDLGRVPAPEGTSLAGLVGSELAITGTTARPRAEGAVRLSGIVAEGPSLPRLSLAEGEVRLEGDRASTGGLRIETLGGVATLEGAVPFAALAKGLRSGPLRPEDEARLRLTWQGLSIDALGASLAGEAELSGGLAGPDEPRMRVTLPKTPLKLADLDLTLAPTTLSLAGGRLAAEEVRLESDAAALRLAGRFDVARRSLDAEARGSLDLRALSPFVGEAALRGTAELDLAVSGPLAAPRPRGTLRVRDGAVRLRLLPQALSGIEGAVTFEGNEARVGAEGRLGGGRIALEGSLGLVGEREVALSATGKELAIEYPPGLRTRLDADLELAGRAGALKLTGEVRVLRGLYDLDLAVREAVRAVEGATEEPALLRSIALDLRLGMVRPVSVRSQLARLDAKGSLTVRGDMQEPAPFGRLEVAPEGKLFVQGREFSVESGSLAYAGTFDPAVALAAAAVITSEDLIDHRVRLTAGGTLEAPSLGFSSDPPLSEREIVSLIATGRTSSSLADSGKWLVGGQAATLFASRVTGGLASSFGLDEITVRPDLAARETEPGARVTFGKRLSRTLNLLYSVGLAGPEARFVQLEFHPRRGVILTGQRRDDGLVTVGAGQRFRWGSAPQQVVRRSGRREPLAEVRFEGDTGLPDVELRRAIRAQPGKRVASWSLQDDAERLRETLRLADFLEAEASARLDGTAAVFEVRAGPRYAWRVEGMDAPPALDQEVRRALFEEEALERGQARLLRELRARGHLRAEVAARAVREGERRVLVFATRPGPRLRLASVRFPGASALDASTLLKAAGGAEAAASDPAAARRAFEAAYHGRLFLAAEVGLPRQREGPDGIEVEFPVTEGPRARLAAVRFEGTTLPPDALLAAAALQRGVPYDEAVVAAGGLRVRDFYWSRGFPYVRVAPSRVVEGTDLAAVFRVVEGDALVVGPIEVAGARRTRLPLIRSRLRLTPGEPLDPRRLGEAERRLLELGTFSRAALRFEPLEESTPGAPRTARIRVEVEEDANRTAGYDLRWSDDEGVTALVEGELRNIAGTGLALGARYRVGADVREARGSVHVPALFRGTDLTGSVFSFEDDLVIDGVSIIRRERGFQLQETIRIRSHTRLLIGYLYTRNETLSPDLPPIPLNIAGADLSVVYDGRDDLLDASHGRFLSLNLELDPSFLGSDAPLVKGFAQAQFAQPIAGGALTWAHSYRLGLAWGLQGEPVVSDERFTAGGPSSLRGFGVDEVGPRDIFGDPDGGEAVAILNQELRWRHASGFGGVAFYDGGNVFPTVSELSFDFRHTLGLGLRWHSPIGLLRLDVGFPLDRQDGEKRYRLYFGIGQAF
jgi:translocation and assembly module TamA